MKIGTKRIILLFIGIVVHFMANAQSKSIAQFNFMLGDWQMKTEKGIISEHWRKNKGTFIGKSYTHDTKGDSVLTESIVLSLVNNVFTFSVTGHEKDNKGTTHFKLISAKDSKFIFENKAHDFPQRIIYQNKGKNQLLAWIEGSVNGKKMKMDFPYQRKK